MQIQLKQETIRLRDQEVKVIEAGWDYTFRFSELEKEMESILADPNHNEIFKFFCKNYYPLMASCVDGLVPSAHEAFSLPEGQLDLWYLTFWKLNEDLLGEPYRENFKKEKVIFRDGSSVTVVETRGLPSFIFKLIELENKAVSSPLQDDPQGQMFISLFYPKMAACCEDFEKVPDAISVRNWPRLEINKWLETSQKLNPEWYQITDEQKQEAAQEKRKKEKTR